MKTYSYSAAENYVSECWNDGADVYRIDLSDVDDDETRDYIQVIIHLLEDFNNARKTA